MAWSKPPAGGGGTPDPNSHTHANKATLDKIGEFSGQMTFDGNPIGGEGGSVDEPFLKSANSATKRPTIYFIFDDSSDYKLYYDNRALFADYGYRFTVALRTDYIGSPKQFTWEMARQMQEEGFEFAYHGTKAQVNTDLVDDVALFYSQVEPEGIKVQGYVGPSGHWDEPTIFHRYFDRFKWARGGGSNGVANVGAGRDYFKLIPSHFIDDLTSSGALDTLKTKIDALSSRGTGVLNLSMHWDSQHTSYLTQLLEYIDSKGNIDVKTVSEAYEVYGAIFELHDSTLALTADLTARGTGNGGISNNVSSPHFVLLKDGSVLSNSAPVKVVTPMKGSIPLNGNTLVDEFGFGITIVQYGTADNMTGLPGQGVLFNFNLGKNPAQQFQLFKAYNTSGIHYRETGTDGAWKTGFTSKLGVYRPVPASKTAAGAIGDFSADANYVYVCYGVNAWVRIAKDSTW